MGSPRRVALAIARWCSAWASRARAPLRSTSFSASARSARRIVSLPCASARAMSANAYPACMAEVAERVRASAAAVIASASSSVSARRRAPAASATCANGPSSVRSPGCCDADTRTSKDDRVSEQRMYTLSGKRCASTSWVLGVPALRFWLCDSAMREIRRATRLVRGWCAGVCACSYAESLSYRWSVADQLVTLMSSWFLDDHAASARRCAPSLLALLGYARLKIHAAGNQLMPCRQPSDNGMLRAWAVSLQPQKCALEMRFDSAGERFAEDGSVVSNLMVRMKALPELSGGAVAGKSLTAPW